MLLDTTFLIDEERGDASLDELIADEDDAAVASITLAELRVGVLLADGRRGRQRAAFLDGIIAVVPSVDDVRRRR